MSIQQRTHRLFEDQLNSWPLLGANWKKLDKARTKRFEFDGFSIRIQFNPGRIISSAAKVDKESIEKRPCFLCAGNRPPEEVHVAFGADYQILCNPFPIFEKHFTISKRDHIPQEIDREFSSFLDLSRELPELGLFYNAPSCGASAPDHMHFQAGSRDFMPIERDMPILKEKYGTGVFDSVELNITAIDDGLRRFYVLESAKSEALSTAFAQISTYMRGLVNGEEPMLNILAYYEAGWQVLVFPRVKHRPWQFFEEGEKNILISPASVDMGGTMITPLEKDFSKLKRGDIEDIFDQITLPELHFNQINEVLKQLMQ